MPESEKLDSAEELDRSIPNQVSEQKIYDDLWIMIQDELVLKSNKNRKKVMDKIYGEKNPTETFRLVVHFYRLS